MADVCQHARSATKRFSTGQRRTGPLGLRRPEALEAWQPSRRTRASHQSQGDTFRIPFWTAVGLFLVSLIAGFASLMLRALFIKLIFAVRRVPMTFFAAADLTAAGQAVITFPLAAVALLNFLPLVVTAWLTPVFFVVMGMLGLITIGTEYVGINKAATFTKSPLVPYAVLTTTCAVVGVLLAWLVTDMAQ